MTAEQLDAILDAAFLAVIGNTKNPKWVMKGKGK